MGKFRTSGGFGGGKNRDGKFGRKDFGRSNFGGKPSFGGRDNQRSEMFDATCDNCGKACQVPFRPNGSKPVYCDDCFSQKRNGSNNGFERRENPTNRFDKPNTFSLDTPTPPVNDKRIDELKKQIDTLNVKIDKLLHLAQTNIQTQSPTAPEPIVSKTPTLPTAIKKSKSVVSAKPKKPTATKTSTKKKVVAKKK